MACPATAGYGTAAAGVGIRTITGQGMASGLRLVRSDYYRPADRRREGGAAGHSPRSMA